MHSIGQTKIANVMTNSISRMHFMCNTNPQNTLASVFKLSQATAFNNAKCNNIKCDKQRKH